MAEVPLKLPTGKITGRLVVEVQDDHDVDQDPEIIPANGMIMVKSSIDHLQIYSETEGKFITFRGPHRAILDDEGYICTPYPGTDEVMYRGLVLWANDSDQLSVKGWTYSMTFSLKAPDGRQLSLPMTTFTLATGQERDIADIVSVPSTPGYGLPQAENSAALAAASALESKQSAEEAQALAQSVRDDADAGAFDGQSAYEIWLSMGNTGTETDFMNWLKGDPGGWVVTQLPVTADPDTLLSAGVFAFEGLTTHAAKLPPGYTAGVIEVLPRRTNGSRTFQRLTPNGVRSSQVFFERFWDGTTWSAWSLFTTTRFDNTIGWSAYQHDPATNADRLTVGDTRWIDMSAVLMNGWTGQVFIRREGNTVWVQIAKLDGTSASTTQFLPMVNGFRHDPPIAGSSFPVRLSGTALAWGLISITTAFYANPGTTTSTSGIILSYPTTSSWPTATTSNSLSFRTGWTGVATVTKLDNSYVLFEMTALNTTQGVTGQSPFAVPGEYMPPTNVNVLLEWTDGTSEVKSLSATTGQIYPTIGKVLKTPVRIMYPATP